MLIQSSYCQTIYPKPILYGKDTVVAITVDQVRDINVMYVKLEQCERIGDSLHVQLLDYEDRIFKSDSLVGELKDQISILGKDRAYEKALLACEEIIKKQNKEIKVLKLTQNISIGIGIITILAYLLK